jgi:hypothetical protein
VSTAQLSPRRATPPPYAETEGSRSKYEPTRARPLLSAVGGWGGMDRHFPAPRHAAAQGPREGVEKRDRGVPSWNRAGTGVLYFVGPQILRSRQRLAVTASGGTWDQVHRLVGVAAVGEGSGPWR